MKIEITGEPEEIAALVLAVQERHGNIVSIDAELGAKALARAKRGNDQ